MENEYNEGSDMDNWEDEQVFQDQEGQEGQEGQEDYGYLGEMGFLEY